ncbi:MAG: NAD(P)H-dependent oxidoreductase [Clostridia bacterium]|nr:NAD(P)H-dependent oxidoreductase [Clostridia bacterium]
MRKLLYITANSKDEQASSSRTVGRKLVNAILQKDTDILLEELDLYNRHIPQLKGCYFESRSAVVSAAVREKLSAEEQREVETIEALCDQFRDADIYVLAAPMWSLSFPAPLKEYIDCVVQAGKTIEFEGDKPHGLLGNKHRVFIYVQSSGASIPWMLRPALNRGLNYIRDIIRFMGVACFEELLVDGTGTTEDERREAIRQAEAQIDGLVSRLI